MKFLERLFLLVGFSLVGWFCFVHAQTYLVQRAQNLELDRALAANRSQFPHPELHPLASTPLPTRAPSPEGNNPRPSLARGALIGRVEIPRLGLSAVIEQGDDTSTLRDAVGHIPGTSLPGESGNIGLAAHRDSFFRGLSKVKEGDQIVLTTFEGTFSYRVASLGIVQPKQTSVLRPLGVNSLTLVTCYPFHFIGPAPDRYIVTALRSGGGSDSDSPQVPASASGTLQQVSTSGPKMTPDRDAPSRPIWLALFLLLLVMLFHAPSGESAPRAPSPAQAPLTVTSDLVDLPVSVTDRQGHVITGLKKENFQIYEAGKLQQINVFDDRDVPVTVGLVVDHSGSMGPKLPEVAAAAAQFARSSNPQDQLFVVNFNEVVSLMLPAAISFTSDQHALQSAVSSSRAQGETALYDALLDAIDHLRLSSQKRQALVLVTDGGDNASRHSLRQVLDALKQSGVQLYCIGLYDPDDPDARPAILRQFARESGGQSYFPASVDQVNSLMAEIAHDLREQYTLGFIPSQANSAQPAWRAVRVAVTGLGRHKLVVRTRPGYLF